MWDATVTVEQGTLRGKISRDRKGKKFYAFQGIPYAKPPLGNLRFKATQPPEPWEGVRNATKEGNECYAGHVKMREKGSLGISVSGSEDCLYLNVYTPETNVKANRPVMFFIHGGAFVSGSSSAIFYGPDYLVAEDVVLVTFNYRLGVLGFMCMEDPALGVPGNAGIKDALQALKWVNANIGQFGGNPENVTVFGQSSGAVLAHLMVLSPLAKGLFHKAILQSGVATCTWALGETSWYKKLAKVLCCSETENRKILEFLQSIPVNRLYTGQKLIGDGYTISTKRVIGPIIESPSSEAILCAHPRDIIKSGNYNHVPIIIGHTSAEGLLTESMSFFNMPTVLTEKNVILPYFYPLKPGTDKYNEAEHKVLTFYFGDAKTVPGSIPYIKAAGDSLFVREPTDAALAHIAVQEAPVYFYIFSAVTSLNLMQHFIKTTVPGASHSDELPYIFRSLLATLKAGSMEELSVNRMASMWTNFAKTGNPVDNGQEVMKNVVWKSAISSEFNFLDIGTKLRTDVNPNKEMMAFWHEIFEFGRKWSQHSS